MKNFVTSVTFLLTTFFSFSQPGEIIVKSGPGGIYLEHEVAAKEGLFSIGRIYNVHPRHLANFNQWNFNSGLSIGQVLKIPLSDTNFSQSVNKGVPVYYVAGSGENMAAIGKKLNNLDVKKLQGWNPGKSTNAGTKLIAGFLISDELKDRVVEVKPVAAPPATQEIVAKKEEPVKKDPPVENKPQEVVKKEPEKTVVQKPVVTEVKKEEANKEPEPDPALVKLGEKEFGFFKNDFQQQVRAFPQTNEQTVTSSIFKTVSGWADEKYYLLINNVEPGTIVKITNPANGKVLYAKTLYSMDKVRKNQGVDIRISDAAASVLSIYETDKFIVQLNY